MAAVLAYFSSQRAHRAEREAQQTRAVAEQARLQAEHLLGYLTDDFVRELESFGRLDVVAEFSKRQIDYFHALPPALKGPETTRNGALAMVHYARAMRRLGKLDVGSATAAEAVQLLEQLRQDGDDSEATTHRAGARAMASRPRSPITETTLPGPPLGSVPPICCSPSPKAPRLGGGAARLMSRCWCGLASSSKRTIKTRKPCAPARGHAASRLQLGARDLSNIDMAAYYAEAGGWLVSALANLGRNDEARRSGEDALPLPTRCSNGGPATGWRCMRNRSSSPILRRWPPTI